MNYVWKALLAIDNLGNKMMKKKSNTNYGYYSYIFPSDVAYNLTTTT